MEELLVIGAPFDVYRHGSSCNNKKPKLFKWKTNCDSDYEVVVDNAIIGVLHKKTNKKRVGWLCESSAILPQLYDVLLNKSTVLFEQGHYEKIFTCDKRLLDKDDRFEFCFVGSNLPWIAEEHWKIYEKTKLCSMIASSKQMCQGHIYRHNIASKYKDNIDLYGGALNSQRFGISNNLDMKWNDKREALVDYMFSITMENDRYETYFTEKLTDCFATGTVPIYWGAPDIAEYFNTDGMIILDESFDINSLTRELYDSKMEAIVDNFERIQKMELADDMLWKQIHKKVKA